MRARERLRAGTSMVGMALKDLGRDLQPWCPLDLSLEWVNTVWDLDFTETEPLDPSVVAEILETGRDAFTKLYGSLFPFATDESGSLESVWSFFTENSISSNTLVALFCHFVQEAHKKKCQCAISRIWPSCCGALFPAARNTRQRSQSSIPPSDVRQVYSDPEEELASRIQLDSEEKKGTLQEF